MAMSRQERAKQFAPFDALRGLREALKRKEEEHERCERKELSEESMAEIAATLNELCAGDNVEVTFFDEGRYVCLRAQVYRVDAHNHILYVGEGKIPFRALFQLKNLS